MKVTMTFSAALQWTRCGYRLTGVRAFPRGLKFYLLEKR